MWGDGPTKPRAGSGAEPTAAPAVGSLDELPRGFERAFVVTDAFAPLPEPGPSDWLALNDEQPQTVAQYLESNPNHPVAPRDVLYIQPLGSMPAASGPTLEQLSRYAAAFFRLEVRVLPQLDVTALRVGQREHHGSHQLDAADILDRMEERIPDDAYCVIAVTWADLYPDASYNFVFGLARLQARVGVFSFARLHPRFHGDSVGDAAAVHRLVMRRALSVMSHEVGHMFGLPHCVHLACNMNGSNSLAESDGQPMHVCPLCLRKLHAVLGFDPRARYAELAALYRQWDLELAADWATGRLAFIDAPAEH